MGVKGSESKGIKLRNGLGREEKGREMLKGVRREKGSKGVEGNKGS